MPTDLIQIVGNYGQLMIEDKPNLLSAILIVAESCIQKIGRKTPRLTSMKDGVTPLPTDSFEDACSILDLHHRDIPTILDGIQETIRTEY